MYQNKDCIQHLSRAGSLKQQRKVLKSFQDCLTKILQYGVKAVIDRVDHMTTTNTNLTLSKATESFQHLNSVQLRSKAPYL